jgi:hypothetical protein
MIRLLTVTALLLWLAKPSCALCCVEGRPADEERGAATISQLPLADDCCRGSNAEHGVPSGKTCCLLDGHSDSLTHHPTDTREPSMGAVVALVPPAGALFSILLTHQPSHDPSSTYLKRGVLLI